MKGKRIKTVERILMVGSRKSYQCVGRNEDICIVKGGGEDYGNTERIQTRDIVAERRENNNEGKENQGIVEGMIIAGRMER